MLFAAQPVPADRLARMGIINHVIPADDIEAFTYAMATTIADNSPMAITVIKEQLRVLAGAHDMSPEDFERIQGLRRTVYSSQDYSEGVSAFKEKRKPNFHGE
jgi:methylmalonyl-CoA decarboxylase